MTLELANSFSGSLLEGLRAHPLLPSLIENAHPFSICTDDPGVFHTDATKELMLLQMAFSLEAKQIYEIVLNSMNQAFCSNKTRQLVMGRLEERLEKLSMTRSIITT